MKILIVYWSGTGNTKIMAEKIQKGIQSENVECDLKEVTDITVDQLDDYDKVAFGCPSMGIENLEEEDFEPFFLEAEAKLNNLKIALFGSYGWGEGEWMKTWEERCIDLGANLFEQGLIINSTPSSPEMNDCQEFGKRFAKF